MPESVERFFNNLALHFRLADLFDIIVVGVFLYLLLSWLRRSTSPHATRRAVVIVTLAGSMFLLARSFEMYMVEDLIRILFLLFGVALVVIFQSNLRRLLDRIGLWGIRRTVSSAEATIALITEAASNLAATHTGALIALKGREPWDHLLKGGVRLGGKVSLPLLYSIFDDRTDGHDGAVVLNGSTVEAFGVHLPLANRLPEVSRHGGTRHAAALGLAERCDALVVVISEERGTISVAENGRLLLMASVADLKDRLDAFYEGNFSAAQVPWTRRLTRRQFSTAIVAGMLSVLAWLLFAYSPDTVYRTLRVPIVLRNLPSEWALQNEVPSEAEVVLSGSEQAFSFLEDEEVVVSIDMADPNAGDNTFVLERRNLSIPRDVQVHEIVPQTVTVSVEPQRRVDVPIEVRQTGGLPESLVLANVSTQPATLTVLVGADTDEAPSTIPTEPVDLNQIAPGTSTIERAINLPDNVRLAPDQPGTVTITLEIIDREPS